MRVKMGQIHFIFAQINSFFTFNFQLDSSSGPNRVFDSQNSVDDLLFDYNEICSEHTFMHYVSDKHGLPPFNNIWQKPLPCS